MDPEFFQKFQAVSQLDVWPQNHIKHFFVFYRTINEFLESFPWLPYIFPSCLSPFRTDIFIILGIIDIEFLLLFVSDIYTAEVVSIRLLTLSIGVSSGVLICQFGILLINFIAGVAIIAVWAKIIFIIICLFLNLCSALCKHAIMCTWGLISESIYILHVVTISWFLVEVLVAEPVVIKAQSSIERLLDDHVQHHHLL